MYCRQPRNDQTRAFPADALTGTRFLGADARPRNDHWKPWFPIRFRCWRDDGPGGLVLRPRFAEGSDATGGFRDVFPK